MLTFSSQQFDTQWDQMNEKLREVLYSPAYTETVLQIAKDNNLDEFKAERVAGFVGHIIFGLLHPEELNDEIIKELNVPRNTAKAVAKAIDTKIFSQFREELNEIYNPIPEKAPGLTLSARPTEEDVLEVSNIKVTQQIPEKSTLSTVPSGPKIIHQEERVSVSKTKTPRRSFILSPGIFKQKGVIKSETPVARITTPKKKGGSRTVHYSELRTPIPGGTTGESFIDLTKLGPASKGAIPYQNIPSQKKEQGSQRSPSLKSSGVTRQKKEQGPKLDGNTVDLRTP